MTTRDDITVNWNVSPRIATVAAPSTELTVQDAVDSLRPIESSFRAMSESHLINASGKEALGGGVLVGVTGEMQNAQWAFATRVNVLESGTVTVINPTFPTLVLTDTASATAFVANGITRGDLVNNVTDNSWASVISIDSEKTITTDGLKGGSDNLFEIGDVYQVFEIVQCNLTGGNMVAITALGGELPPILKTFGTHAVRTSSSSATLQELSDIQHASFNGGITIDVVNGTNGTAFPTGTTRQPVKNVADALIIDATRGFTKLYVKGNLTLTTGHDLTGWEIAGESQSKTILTVDAGAVVDGVEIFDCEVLGTLDQNASLTQCKLTDLSFFEGFISHCQLASGTLVLGGTADLHIIDCHSGVPGGGVTDAPIIDMNGGGRDLLIRNYSGGIRFQNCASPDEISIDLLSGQVIIDSNVTMGDFTIRGIGKMTDNSNGATVNDGGLVRGSELTNIRHSLELLQLSGSAYGTTFYWNPETGNDANDGLTPNGACATFTHVHDNLVIDEHNDVIVILGHHTVTTPISIIKHHVHLRGPGRHMRFVPSSPGLPTIAISGDNCSISNAFLSTAAGGNDSGIVINGDRCILHKIWIDGCTNNGVEIRNSAYSEFHHCDIEDNGNDGIVVADNVRELMIMSSDIYKNANNGVTVGGSVQNILRFHMNRVYDNIGYGLDILPSASNTLITGMTYIVDNATGNIRDLGVQTHNQMMDMQNSQTDLVWEDDVTQRTTINSSGEALGNVSAGASPSTIAAAVWAEVLTASGNDVDDSAAVMMKSANKGRKLASNKATITIDGSGVRTVTIFDDDGVTPIHVHTVQADLLDRTPS